MKRSAAWFEAWHRKNPAGARSFLISLTASLGEEPYAAVQTEATILFAEGQFEKARETALQALCLISDPPKTGYDRMDRDRLREIIAVTSTASVVQ